MSDLSFTFDQSKAVETILYLANRINKPRYHNITHLIYFADKTSLERYGRFIFGDDYYAMQYGPVPTCAYNMLKESEWTDKYDFVAEQPPNISPKRDADLDYFSESDLECLDLVIELYNSEPFWKIKKDSHDEAYAKAWDERGIDRSARMSIESIVSLLQDPDELLVFLTGETEN